MKNQNNNNTAFWWEMTLLADNLNTVVKAFHKYQLFKKIQDRQEAFRLAADPVGYFDRAVIEGGGLPADTLPVPAASMLKIDREGFQEAIRLPANTVEPVLYFQAYLPKNKKNLFVWQYGFFRLDPAAMKNVKPSKI